MTGYRKKYSSEKWYSAMRREQKERQQLSEQVFSGTREEPFLEETFLFDELRAKDSAYLSRKCVQKRSEKILKVACRYLEGFLGLRKYKSMSELMRKYGVSEASIRKRSMEVARILGYNIESFAKGSRMKYERPES